MGGNKQTNKEKEIYSYTETTEYKNGKIKKTVIKNGKKTITEKDVNKKELQDFLKNRNFSYLDAFEEFQHERKNVLRA